MREKCEFDVYSAALGMGTACILPHRNRVDSPGGYRLDACICSKKSTTNGVVQPFRRFITSDYICVTLDTAYEAGVLLLSQTEIDRLKIFERDSKNVPKGKDGMPSIRGLAESSSVYFFWTTRWLSGQATAQGIESATSTSIPLFAKNISKEKVEI